MRRATRALLVFLLAVAALAADHSGNANAGLPGAPVVKVSAASPTSLKVSWTSSTSPSRWWVILTSAGDDRSAGQRTVSGTARSVVVQHLAPGSAYLARVVAVDPATGFGTFSVPVTGRTPGASACSNIAAGTTCALVNTTAPVGAASGVGDGFVHSITDATDPSRVTALQPTAWRISALDFARFADARKYGGAITALVSDPWATGMGSPAPWDMWDWYKMWLGFVVDLHVQAGMIPDYWEIQNEPDGPLSYVSGTPRSPDLVFQQYLIASEVIHQKLPDAKVIGPSPSYVTFGSGMADIDGFLQKAAASDMHLAGVSWHEIGAGCLGYCDGSPRAVLQHADDVRASIAANPSLGKLSLQVNEYGAPWDARQPGANVGYLSSLAYAGVDLANETCNPVDLSGGGSDITCWRAPGMLDGLLMDDGTTPTDAWFVHQAYAQMTGAGFTLLDSTIADPEASVVSTVGANGAIHVLLGRHTGCQVGIDDMCPGASYAAPKQVAAVLSVARNSRARYNVTVQRIASVHGASSGPVTIATTTVAAANGRVNAGTYTVADGEALILTLTPA